VVNWFRQTASGANQILRSDNSLERPIYGKIRYMSFASTSRKFDSRAYIEKWNA
jgi:hypothetical protein